ncbi:MAG: hypothetical protein PVF17_11030, partial [Ignavibacteria bacterium]
MKKIIISSVLLLNILTFPQNVSPQFSELKGIEDQQGNTHLFYRIYSSGYGTMGYYYSNSIYRLEAALGIDLLFLTHGGFAGLYNEVNDYTFWGKDYNRYVYAGTHIYIEATPEVYRYDQANPVLVPQMWGSSTNVELSMQDTNLIVVSINNGINYKSTDWGNNWDTLSTGYEILSISPFDESIIFAGQSLSLFKSTDGGSTYYT